ncbi:MAG: hypothetical protein LIO37_03585 [Clostridiales bacterium]|nr:hypothetical protein [Clostridiales bacterium]
MLAAGLENVYGSYGGWNCRNDYINIGICGCMPVAVDGDEGLFIAKRLTAVSGQVSLEEDKDMRGRMRE